MKIFTDYVSEFPLVTRLIDKGRDVVATKESLSNLEAELKALLRSEEPARIVDKCIAELATNPAADPAFMRQGHIMLCNDFGGLVVAIGKTQAGAAHSPLFSSTNEALLGALSENGFSYRIHDISDDWNRDIFSPDVTVGNPESHHCPAGSSVLVSTSKIYDYASTDDIVVKVAAPSEAGLMWEFDRSTHKAKRVYASTLEATTVSYIVKFLSEYGNENSVSAIRHLVSHPFHFIRWDVAKALGRLDPEAFAEVLADLERDAHPHVNAAAKKMLAHLEQINGN